jgi:hypothetical protein
MMRPLLGGKRNPSGNLPNEVQYGLVALLLTPTPDLSICFCICYPLPLTLFSPKPLLANRASHSRNTLTSRLSSQSLE